MKLVLMLCTAVLLSSKAYAIDYYNAKVTGIGIVAGENRIRFTIDKDPNVIFLTDQFTGDQLNKLTSMVLAAHAAQSSVYLIRTTETANNTTRHYENVTIFTLGTYTFN